MVPPSPGDVCGEGAGGCAVGAHAEIKDSKGFNGSFAHRGCAFSSTGMMEGERHGALSARQDLAGWAGMGLFPAVTPAWSEGRCGN